LDFQTFDAGYIRRLTDGDGATEDHFASYFGSLLYLKLRARLRSRQLIEDVRQETLLRVLEILRQKNGVNYPERFGSFVNSVCNNVMREFCREPQPEGESENRQDPPDTSIDLDAPLLESDLKRQVRQMLAEVPDKDRRLLEAVYLEELDKSEVCRRFKVDPEYLRVRLHRAKLRCRRAAAAGGRRTRTAPLRSRLGKGSGVGNGSLAGK